MSTKKLNPKILIVEDDVSTYNNLRKFFLKAGFEILAREDGKAVDNYDAAMVLAASNKPDMAILDIEINGDKDGLILGKDIVDRYKIPVVFLTGKDTMEHRMIADRFASIPIIEKLSKSLPNEMLLKSVNFLWAKILQQTPPPSEVEIWAAEMRVNPENFDDATAIDEVSVKRIVDCDAMHFISSFNNQVSRNNNLIHVNGTKAFRVRDKIDDLLVLLGPGFRRVSKFAAIKIKAVQSFDVKSKTCKVKNYTIKIGKDYWPGFLKEMDQH